jgi:hypothetical protein
MIVSQEALYGFNTLEQAHGFIRDLKLVCSRSPWGRSIAQELRSWLGQNTKLPPRVIFTVQSLGAIVVSVHSSPLNRGTCTYENLGRIIELHCHARGHSHGFIGPFFRRCDG